MYVSAHMSQQLVTISPKETISLALELMKIHKIHRLPVVIDGILVGLITEGMISKYMPSSATTLDIFELNYLLSKTKVDDIMVTRVITATPDMLLEKAADVMAKKDIGCLPVVDERKRVLGILTTNDVLTSFAHVMGLHDEGTRVVLEFALDHIGLMAEVSSLFFKHGFNITHIMAFNDESVQMVIKTSSLDKDKIKAMCEGAKFKVASIQ
jgi:acetoin utilization protein AcuB